MFNANISFFKGNWVDLIILLVILFYLYEGWRRGLILGLIDLSGFILSFLLALKNYRIAGNLLVNNFSLPLGIANAVGFLLSGFMTEIIFSILINLFYLRFFPKILSYFNKKHLDHLIKKIDKIFGFIPVVGESLIFSAFVLTLLLVLPIPGSIKKDITLSKIGSSLIANTQGVERQINTIFGNAVNETLTFLTINSNPTIGEKVDLHFTQEDIKNDEAAENKMFDLVNQEREKNRLAKLVFSDQLGELAREHAIDMFAKGFFSHTNRESESPFTRMKKKGIDFTAAGENLAYAPNVQLAHLGLMNSPGHRANILSTDFGKVGIGVIDGGIYGEMFVQEFTD